MLADLERRACATNELSFLWLEITAKCNLFCSHCYAESGPGREVYGDMRFADWVRVIDEAAELGCRSIQFIGGEPTMHPRLHDLVDRANHRGFSFIEVYTNATRLGDDLIGCFRANGVRVATSFYSDDPAVHERVTQTQDSWRRTLDGIAVVLAAKLPLRVGVIETDHNVGHGPRALAFLKTLGIENARIDRQRGVGRGELIPLGGESERFDELCGECWKGRLCVTSSGEAYPCVFARRSKLGDARLGLRAILETATLSDFRGTIRARAEQRPRRFTGPVDQQQCPPVTDPCNPTFCGPDGPCNPQDCPPGDACNPQLCNPCQP